jgi:hypothetical protein
MGEVGSSELSARFYQTTRYCAVSEDTVQNVRAKILRELKEIVQQIRNT